MWYSTKKIDKLIPAFVSKKPTRVDFFNVRKYNSYILPSNYTYINYLLFKLIFSNFKPDPSNNLTISPVITNIYDIDNYQLTSLDIVGATKSYITPFNGLDTSDLEPIYIFKDLDNDLNSIVTLDLELSINSISKYTDIYNLLYTSIPIKDIKFKDNYYSTELTVTKDFLTQVAFTLDNIVTITYNIDIDLHNLKTLFFSSTLHITPYKLSIFNIDDTNYISDYPDLELVKYKSDNYFKLYSIEDVYTKSTILNSNTIILID